MEEKRFDPYQFIGFILIALILTWMLYQNNPENYPAEKNKVNNVEPSENKNGSIDNKTIENGFIKSSDDLANLFVKPSVDFEQIENQKIEIEISTKGANISKLRLKEFDDYKKTPLFLINEDNTDLNLQINLSDGRILNTSEMYFIPKKENRDDNQVLILKSQISENKFISFVYSLKKDSYFVDFKIETQGISNILSTKNPPKVIWKSDVFRNSKSIDYENRYTELTYGYDGDKVDYLSLSGDDEELVEEVRWVSYRQHFFSSIIVPETPFDKILMKSNDLAVEKSLKEKYTKSFESEFYIENTRGDLDSSFKFYFGPSDYQTLKDLDGDLEGSIPLGWGIFGWINRFVFLPLFGFLSSFLPHGISIIIMTIIVRLAMSPVTYKSYVSQIKMKVLRPEVEEIAAKYKNDAVKKQQETMSLYTRAGANPLSGCVPALIQLPVFYALFTFFPVAFVLRQKSFLWAEDLSSYDSIYDLPFNIPFYGDHISLFPILASIAIFFYTKMTTGQQPMPQQPGMPNMKVIMYLMPLMMLFFFNNYSSGLSLYYFVSNLLTIILMLVIKNYIIDNEKILQKIEENKNKPRKPGGFAARLQKAMEEAEKQKKSRKGYR
ncbi:MAG: membrane protein insertase YidC [Flavobacteriaceae bacterium]|nr:membrane protein insertase YidC [Flavobacteriaceae bacterium]|tara:strand:+ start:3921 stop:5744 length:1824 start_codon:yes stop_codon:yes gene_type:complete